VANGAAKNPKDAGKNIQEWMVCVTRHFAETRTRLLIVLPAAAIMAAGLFFAWHLHPDQDRLSIAPLGKAPSVLPSDGHASLAIADVEYGNLSIQESASDSSGTILDAESFDILSQARQDWMKQRGWAASKFVQSSPDYLSYPLSTLDALADTGDWLAITALASELETSDTPGALKWHRELAVLGSTYSITSIVRIYQDLASANVSDTETSDSQLASPTLGMNAEQAKTMALGWALLADMRGDPYGQIMARQLEQQFHIGQDVMEIACSEALQLYSELSASRASKSLPPLDDSGPPLVSVPYQQGVLCPTWQRPQSTCERIKPDNQDMTGYLYHCY